MKKDEIGLSRVNLDKLSKIEDEIDNLDDLDEKMDYVDCLSIYFHFDDLEEGQEDMIDEYLRSIV